MSKRQGAAEEQRVEIPMQTREAPIAPGSINVEQRTVELVWTSGAKVRRYDWWEGRTYDEELVVSPEACDLTRLNGGAPLLDTHFRYSLAGQIGVVERAWLDGKEGRAIVRFSPREEVEPIWNDVRAGIIRNVSVGYEVRKYEVTKEEGKPDLYRATDWQPHEVSLVPVGADMGAGTRGRGSSGAPAAPTNTCILFNRTAPAAHNPEETMTKTTPQAGTPSADPTRTAEPAAPAAATTAAATAIDTAAVERAATETERKRGQDIRVRVRSVGLPEAFADDLITRAVALDHVGNAIVDELAKRGTGQTAKPRIEGGVDHTDPAVVRTAITTCLAARAAALLPTRIGQQKPAIEMTDQARQYAGLGILELMAEYARACGEKVDRNLPKGNLFERLLQIRSLSTSDFPIILADAQNKILVKAYELATPTYRSFAARKQFNDFKPHKFIRAGDFPNLLAVGETGEVQFGAMSETQQQITLATYARAMRITRRMLINDDLGAFADIPNKIGRRVADFENQTFYAQFALNAGAGPTITETTRPVWNATDVTLAGAGAAITIASVSAGRAAMRAKTSLDGLKLNVGPRILLTSPTKETEAQQFVSQNLLPQQITNVNPFAGTLLPVADANLSGTPWYLFADPADLEVFIYGFLEGQEGPRLMTDEPFTTDGLAIKVMLDFVAGAIDFRGTWKDPGA